MKNKPLTFIGKQMMKWGKYKICIVDDEDIYFNRKMLNIAKESGFTFIDRYRVVDNDLHRKILKDEYDLIILDVKGSTDNKVAKDGINLASSLNGKISAFIVLTSAHQFHLSNETIKADYIIENRNLTNVDFIEVLTDIVGQSLDKKIKFYKKLVFKTGFKLLKAQVN